MAGEEAERHASAGLDGPWSPVRHQQESGPATPTRSAVEQVSSLTARSSEHDDWGWYALGLGAAALVMVIVAFVLRSPAGMQLVGLGACLTAMYFGVRSHNAEARGFATNAWAGRTGFVLGVLVLLGQVLIQGIALGMLGSELS